jgi:protease-4
MNKNTFSLLSSNWMINQSSKAALMPFLLSILKGQNISSDSLEPTKFLFADASGNFQSLENSEGLSIQQNSVAIVNIHHPIFKYDQTCGPKGTQSIMQTLREFEANPNIKGVVLDFNSGGGQASGNAEFFDFIKDYSKPVVSFTKDMIGSAAYYMASASDFIIAHKHADFIGSIGTMFSKIDIQGALKKQGVEVIEEYSDLSPDKNKLSRSLAAGDTSVLIKEYLNPMASQFHEAVKSARPNITEKALKGDIFNPKQSLKEGLIDQIGTLQNAIDKVFEISKANTNTNSQTMSKNYSSIQETLGLEVAFESNNDAGFFLSEEQMETLENKISGIPASIEAATKPLNATITDFQETVRIASEKETAISASITAALTTADITEELNGADAITALAKKVVEYGQLDGSKHTIIVNNANDKNIGATNIVGGVDISLAMNN